MVLLIVGNIVIIEIHNYWAKGNVHIFGGVLSNLFTTVSASSLSFCGRFGLVAQIVLPGGCEDEISHIVEEDKILSP